MNAKDYITYLLPRTLNYRAARLGLLTPCHLQKLKKYLKVSGAYISSTSVEANHFLGGDLPEIIGLAKSAMDLSASICVCLRLKQTSLRSAVLYYEY